MSLLRCLKQNIQYIVSLSPPLSQRETWQKKKPDFCQLKQNHSQLFLLTIPAPFLERSHTESALLVLTWWCKCMKCQGQWRGRVEFPFRHKSPRRDQEVWSQLLRWQIGSVNHLEFSRSDCDSLVWTPNVKWVGVILWNESKWECHWAVFSVLYSFFFFFPRLHIK